MIIAIIAVGILGAIMAIVLMIDQVEEINNSKKILPTIEKLKEKEKGQEKINDDDGYYDPNKSDYYY